jgi:hypothetical protein
MKLLEIKQIIKEEVILHKLTQCDLSIIETYSNLLNSLPLNESFLSSLLGVFLDRKYRRKAEEFKKTPEYKDLMLQLKISADSLNAVTTKLKDAIDEKESLSAAAQKLGIKVRPFTTIDDLVAQYPNHAKLLARYKKTK